MWTINDLSMMRMGLPFACCQSVGLPVYMVSIFFTSNFFLLRNSNRTYLSFYWFSSSRVLFWFYYILRYFDFLRFQSKFLCALIFASEQRQYIKFPKNVDELKLLGATLLEYKGTCYWRILLTITIVYILYPLNCLAHFNTLHNLWILCKFP